MTRYAKINGVMTEIAKPQDCPQCQKRVDPKFEEEGVTYSCLRRFGLMRCRPDVFWNDCLLPKSIEDGDDFEEQTTDLKQTIAQIVQGENEGATK